MNKESGLIFIGSSGKPLQNFDCFTERPTRPAVILWLKLTTQNTNKAFWHRDESSNDNHVGESVVFLHEIGLVYLVISVRKQHDDFLI